MNEISETRPAGRCLQLVRPIKGRRVGKGVIIIIIDCADPVPGKNSITNIGRYILGLL